MNKNYTSVDGVSKFKEIITMTRLWTKQGVRDTNATRYFLLDFTKEHFLLKMKH